MDETVSCRPYRWESEDVDGKLVIRVWGVDELSNPSLWIIRGFTPHCVLELHNDRWNLGMVKYLRSKIVSKVDNSDRVLPFKNSDFCMKKKLYSFDFNSNSVPTLTMYGVTKSVMSDLKRVGEEMGIPVYESDVDVVSKLLVSRGIRDGELITTKGRRVVDNERISIIGNEYEVDYTQLTSV